MFFDVSIHHRIGDCHIALSLRSQAVITALVGPSGVGKSTVISAIAGLIAPESGSISAGGQMLFNRASGVDLPPDKRRAGVVFQDMRLFPHRKVAGNLAYAERLCPPGQQWIDRAEILRALGIEGLLGRWPASLSGGEMRRVAIARALLCGPRFLLLDEPFAGIDAERADTVRALLERIRDDYAIPMILVTHDARDVARLAGDVVRMG